MQLCHLSCHLSLFGDMIKKVGVHPLGASGVPFFPSLAARRGNNPRGRTQTYLIFYIKRRHVDKTGPHGLSCLERSLGRSFSAIDEIAGFVFEIVLSLRQ